MKKCVDELAGRGTFIAPDAPCPVLAVGAGVGVGLGFEARISSDLGTKMVLSIG